MAPFFISITFSSLSCLSERSGLVRRNCGGDPAIEALWNVYPVECLPRGMFTPWNAQPIQLGRSLFNWGEAYSTGAKPIQLGRLYQYSIVNPNAPPFRVLSLTLNPAFSGKPCRRSRLKLSGSGELVNGYALFKQ